MFFTCFNIRTFQGRIVREMVRTTMEMFPTLLILAVPPPQTLLGILSMKEGVLLTLYLCSKGTVFC